VGLLHPTADPGVHRVSASTRAVQAHVGASPPMPHPPEPSPPVQPYPRLREPLPSCRCRLRSRGHRVLLDFKALLRTSSALRGLPLPAGHRPLLSWASRLGASRSSSHHRTRRPPEGRPASAVHARTLSGDRARRACVPSPRRCGLPVRAGPREAGELGLCTRGGTILPGQTGKPVGWGPRQGPEANPGGPQAGWQAHGRQRTAVSSPRPGCPGPERGPHRCGADLPKQARGITPCRTSCPGRRWWRQGPRGQAPLRALGRGPGRRRTRREEAPRPSPRDHPLAGGATPPRQPARQRVHRRPRRGLAGPRGRVRLVPGSGLGVGCTGSPRCHHARARTLRNRASPPWIPLARSTPGCPPGEAQRSSAPHPLAPLAGDEASAPPSRGKRAGSAARMCPHRPRPAPEVFPMQSVTTAPRGTTRDRPGVFPHALASRPCRASICSIEFASGASGWSNIRPCSSRLVIGALRCAGLFARTPRPRPVRVASPAGDRRPGGPCSTAPVTGRGGQPSAKPPASDLAAAGPRASPPSLPGQGRVHAGVSRVACRHGLPRGSWGKDAPAPSPALAEGASPLARGEPAWPGERVIDAARVAGFRSTCRRGSRERPSPARLACVAGRSRAASPRGRGPGSEDRRDACSVAASTRETLVGRASRDAGLPSGPSSRGVSPSCVLA
jgi:hypothetical protein